MPCCQFPCTRCERFAQAILVFTQRIYALRPGWWKDDSSSKVNLRAFPPLLFLIRFLEQVSVGLFVAVILWNCWIRDLQNKADCRECKRFISSSFLLERQGREWGKKWQKKRVIAEWEEGDHKDTKEANGTERLVLRSGGARELGGRNGETRERERRVKAMIWSEDRDRQGRRGECVINHPVWHSRLQGSFTVQHSLLLAVH